ncbi:hypothetical protein CLOM_g7413, partial [Closterium sp. NIES-68]
LTCSIRRLNIVQSDKPSCERLHGNRWNPFRSASPSWFSLCQLGVGPLDQPARKAFVRTRTRDQSLAIRCDAGKSSTPAEAPEEEIRDFESERKSDSKPALTVGAEFVTRGVGEGEGDSEGGEGEESVRIVGKEEGGNKEGKSKRSGRRAGKAKGRSEGSVRKRRGGAGCEEEEAVAVIAGFFREKFGPQIVRQEFEEGSEYGRIEDEVEREREEEEQELGVDTELEEVEEEEAITDTVEEGSPATTSRRTRPTPQPNARATSPSSLLALYRFFSSHLGISSPSTVASVLASRPQILRSNPTNDLLPRVHLLQP